MDNLKQLADELSSLDDKLVKCMRCGTCQSVCPVFAETKRESDVTRGKLALLSNLATGLIEDPKAVRERLDRCLLCGSCQSACPSGVSILDIFMRAREIAAQYMGLNSIKKIAFRVMLCNPKLFAFLVKVGRPFHPLFLRDQKNAPHTACAPLMKPAIGDRRIPIMPKTSISEKYPNLDIPAGKSGLKVLFFPGCMGDKVYTNVSEACLKIFRHFGVGVRIPQNLACCGIPALASGDVPSFKKMLEHDIDIFEKCEFDYVVTACSSCTETIGELWAKYAGGAYAEKAEKIGKKAIDINAFLTDVLKVDLTPKGSPKERLTYHDSCHLKKSLGISEQPRKLLRANANYEFTEMREADRCCGCGGSFTLTHYGLSRKIGQRKRDNIAASDAKTVACGCPACMMQLSNMLALNNDDIKVKHVAEIFADTLDD